MTDRQVVPDSLPGTVTLWRTRVSVLVEHRTLVDCGRR